MMAPTDPRHGSRAGADEHYKTGTPTCEPCRRAAARYENERRLDLIAGRPRRVDSTGTARRIQALVAMGYTFQLLAEHLRTSHDVTRKLAFPKAYLQRTTAARVAELYDRLCMTPPPTGTPQQRRVAAYARTVARKYGWVPPLAWDDDTIDDPTARPAMLRPRKTWAAADLAAEWEHLQAAGLTLPQAAERLGLTTEAIRLAIRRTTRRQENTAA